MAVRGFDPGRQPGRESAVLRPLLHSGRLGRPTARHAGELGAVCGRAEAAQAVNSPRESPGPAPDGSTWATAASLDD